MTIRIVHLITGLRVGGAEHMLEKLVTGMDRAAFSNTVVSLTSEGPIGARLRAAGIPVHALGMTGLLSLPRTLYRLGGLLRQDQPQMLQTWLYHADLVGTVTRALAYRNVRLLWNLRCSDMNLSDYSLATRMVLRLLAPLSHQPAGILTNSEAGRRHHIRLGYRDDGWTTIPNGFDLTQFQCAQRGTLRQALGVDTRTRLVGLVARLDPMKDHDNFIAMAERLAVSHPDLHFVLIGRGCTQAMPALAGARALLGHRLHLLGERADVAALLPDLDVLTLTSAYGEGFPNVLGEALACGVPSVATDVGDSARVLGDCGITVPPRDPQALADAVARILAMPDNERAAWQTRMRQRAEDNFSLPAVIARYESYYRTLAPQAAAGAVTVEKPN
jgi:glycosyltransferase involved in cell wall biosynthesis